MKSEGVGLIDCAISFQDFQPVWSWSTNVTDRRTDRRTTCNLNTALCTSASRGNKTKYIHLTNKKHNTSGKHKSVTNDRSDRPLSNCATASRWSWCYSLARTACRTHWRSTCWCRLWTNTTQLYSSAAAKLIRVTHVQEICSLYHKHAPTHVTKSVQFYWSAVFESFWHKLHDHVSAL